MKDLPRALVLQNLYITDGSIAYPLFYRQHPLYGLFLIFTRKSLPLPLSVIFQKFQLCKYHLLCSSFINTFTFSQLLLVMKEDMLDTLLFWENINWRERILFCFSKRLKFYCCNWRKLLETRVSCWIVKILFCISFKSLESTSTLDS